MNSHLRQICGFETHGVKSKHRLIKLVHAPSKSSYSHFIQDLEEVYPDIENWVLSGVHELYSLPNFGVNLALDGKFIDSYASPYDRHKKRQDKCADLEADSGIKQRYHRNGTVTIAKQFIGKLSVRVLKRTEYLMADKVYSGSPLQNLLEEAHITAIIDNPHKWQGDDTRQYLETDLIYNQSGEVFWVNDRGQAIQLTYKGYDSSCDSLRYGFHPKYQDRRFFRINDVLSQSSLIESCEIVRSSRGYTRIVG